MPADAGAGPKCVEYGSKFLKAMVSVTIEVGYRQILLCVNIVYEERHTFLGTCL